MGINRPDRRTALRARFSTGYPRQAVFFPTTKKDLEATYSRRLLARVEEYLSFDYDSLDDFQPYEEDEIRFYATIRQLCDELLSEDPFVYFIDKLPAGHHTLEKMYFNVFEASWDSFYGVEEEAVDKYVSSLTALDAVELLEGLLDGAADDADVIRGRLADLIARIDENNT